MSPTKNKINFILSKKNKKQNKGVRLLAPNLIRLIKSMTLVTIISRTYVPMKRPYLIISHAYVPMKRPYFFLWD